VAFLKGLGEAYDGGRQDESEAGVEYFFHSVFPYMPEGAAEEAAVQVSGGL
jgi:hypothetical protein